MPAAWLINGEVNARPVLFGQTSDGDRIITVEGLGDVDHLAPIQQCFIDEVGAQCGICTPGCSSPPTPFDEESKSG